ncbi:MAG TPA: type II secretion system minor pseudopilin GspI [Deltaproteobacteria bacterium]|nr:type II secretion system minor pseudopilin GspI [Deltaproteobacteria bacterium]HOM29543.1 type II secretion system minor pseudopilin GspI [Deltaproteobacteria bacterium]HPP79995.1 type II secretion system minor pseudopilin GspI [Deltaproteobacteria bacterium]
MARRGFTLIEVLVALTILAIAFTWLISAHGQSIDMATRSRFLTTATLLAQERIAAVTTGLVPVPETGRSGDFGEDHPGYTYEEDVESTPIPGYLKYTLKVKWGAQERPLETRFVAFVSRTQ